MNILLITPVVPFPPDSGPKVKTYHLLRYLSTKHRVTLVTFVANEWEETQLAGLQELCADIHVVHRLRSRLRDLVALATTYTSGLPFAVDREASMAMHTLLANVVAAASAQDEPFDLMHVDQLPMAQFAKHIALPTLLDRHLVGWRRSARISERAQGPRRWFHRREARLLRQYESRCDAFDAITVVSAQDKQSLLDVMPYQRELTVIPIGVDAMHEVVVERDLNARWVMSLGTMSRPENVEAVCWFAQSIYPLVRRVMPDVQFYVCGPRPTAKITALPEHDQSIVVTGYVEDPSFYIARSACMVVPQHSGSGVRVKILEALARGIPVVSTTMGYEGLDLVSGEHLLVADKPSEFADAVRLLLREPEFGARLAAAGRQRVLERYDWQVVCPAIDRVYAQMTTQSSRVNRGMFGAPPALKLVK